jgi:hypothetical protein
MKMKETRGFLITLLEVAIVITAMTILQDTSLMLVGYAGYALCFIGMIDLFNQ